MLGSDLPKQEEQLGEGIVHTFPYNFSQNGLVAYKDGQVLEIQTIAKFLGEDNIKRIVNWTLAYLSKLDLPVKVSLESNMALLWILLLVVFMWWLVSTDEDKGIDNGTHRVWLAGIHTYMRFSFSQHILMLFLFTYLQRGTFIEFRSGMLNISPIGRNCSRDERNDYEVFDLANNVRQTMVNAMRTEFADLNLTFSIGGQISFDVFPTGWDKTYCLHFLPADDFDEIHFFGDKTFVGGNDYEIFTHERTIGHTVTSPADTMQQCTELFLKK